MATFKSLGVGNTGTSTARTAFDPLGVDPLGVNDAIFGKQKGPDYSAEEAAKAAALAKSQAATDAFTAGGAPTRTWDTLGPAAQQQSSQLGNISTDPAYKNSEMSALSSLEDQGKNGFTAQNRADQVQAENDANTANRGRIGAIEQRMQARGAGGSGMDLVAQLQSAQDANNTEAMRSLENESNKEQAQTNATAKAGSLAQSLQGQDFSQQAQQAAAQDAVNRFNTQTTNQTNQYNNQGQNATDAGNVADGYNFRKDVLGANQGQATTNYNVGVDNENNAKLANQAAENKKAGVMGFAGSIAGGVLGGIYGGPSGATAGSQVGAGTGQQAGRTSYRNSQSYWQGGKVPDDAPMPGDNPLNDTHNINVAGGEIIVPRTKAKSPKQAAAFAAKAAAGEHDHDVVGHMLAAMSAMHGKGK
jgi:hypothetical protein